MIEYGDVRNLHTARLATARRKHLFRMEGATPAALEVEDDYNLLYFLLIIFLNVVTSLFGPKTGFGNARSNTFRRVFGTPGVFFRVSNAVTLRLFITPGRALRQRLWIVLVATALRLTEASSLAMLFSLLYAAARLLRLFGCWIKYTRTAGR